MSYKVDITISGLPDDDEEYKEALETIEAALKPVLESLGCEMYTGIGEEE